MIAMPAVPITATIVEGSPAPPARLSTIYRVLDLHDDPFARDPRGGVFARTSVHAAAREGILRWIADGASPDGPLGIVVGDPGTGKTRLLAELAATLADDAGQQVAVLPDDNGLRTDAQILRGILSAFGHTPVGRTGLELLGEIGEALGAIRRAGLRPGILIDGADFAGSRLELTRNLLRAGAPHGLWVVLLGQPDLRDRIARRRSLRGLLTLTVELPPLAEADCRALLEQRIAAMQRMPRRLLSDDALAIVIDWSEGNAARLVQLAGECLVEAIARGRDIVDAAIAHQVARELTDQARARARAEASPRMEPVVQTKIPLFLDDTPGEASSATTPARPRRGVRR